MQAFGATQVVCEHIACPEEEQDVQDVRNTGAAVTVVWQSSLLDPEDLPFSVQSLPQVFTQFRTRVEASSSAKPRRALPAPTSMPPAPSANDSSSQQVPPIGIRRFRESGRFLLQTAVTEAEEASAGSGANVDDPRSSFPYRHSSFRGGETAAMDHVRRYFSSGLLGSSGHGSVARPQALSYKQTRNGLTGTTYSTKLSPWLALGAVSPRFVYEQLKACEAASAPETEGTYWIWFELLWRDYFRFLHMQHGRKLYLSAGLLSGSSAVAKKPPPHDPQRFEAWCAGNTGEVFNDAGMRELIATGYLSNRLRQNVAS
jgi:deoxyribodipyrimidine photo-lyase